jgi:signal peptidase
MKKTLTYIISILTTICFILTLVIILLGIKANASNNIVKVFGYSYSVVATDSMEPTIEVGEVIISKSIPYEEVSSGDIIVFWSDHYQKYIVHRVVDIVGDKLVTKGDNPAAPVDQDYVENNDFHGVVIKYGNFFNVGKLIIDYRDVVYGLIIFLFFYIIVMEIISITRNLKKAKEEELKKESVLLRQRIYEEEKAKILEEMKKD